MPEVNITAQNATPKDELAHKVGIKGDIKEKPLLMIMMEAFMAGEVSQAAAASKKGPETMLSAAPAQNQMDPLIDQRQKPVTQQKAPETAHHLDKARDLLDEVQHEEKQGFNLGGALGGGAQKQPHQEENKRAEVP